MRSIDEIESEIVTQSERQAEAERTENRVRHLQAVIGRTEAALPALQAQVRSERDDVDRLEGWTFSRLWAMARGSHDDELGRERTEACRAQTELQQARAQLEENRRDLRDALRHRAEMAGAADHLAAALRAKEELLRVRGTPTGRQLGDLALRRGEISRQFTEISEALAAVAALLTATRRATDLLQTSRWPSAMAVALLDTWTPNLAQRQLDEATAAVAFAARHVQRLNWELSQVKDIRTTLRPLAEGTFRHYTDVWFQGASAEALVMERVGRARAEVLRVSQDAVLMHHRLMHLWREAQAQDHLLATERRELLNLR